MAAVYRTQRIGGFENPDHLIQYHGPPPLLKESLKGFRRPKISPMKRPSMNAEGKGSLSRHGSKRKLSREYKVPTKTAFHKPGYYRFPHTEYSSNKHVKRARSIKHKPKYCDSIQIDSVFNLCGDNQNITTIPYYLLQYSLRKARDSCKWNPVIRYEVERAKLKQNEITLEDSGFNMEQYLTLPISDIMHVVEDDKDKNAPAKAVSTLSKKEAEKNSLSMKPWTNEQMKKYGLSPKSLRSLDQTDYRVKKQSIGGISEIAELSIESNSELYDECFADISGKHYKTWTEVLSYLKKESPEIYSNDYFLLRLMLNIYLRRIIAARISASLGTEKSRRTPNHAESEIWNSLADNVKAVYGLKQLHVFQQQK